MFPLFTAMKSKLAILIACLLIFTIETPVIGYSVGVDDSPPALTIESPPQDIGDVVKLLTPSLRFSDVKYLLSLIPTSMPARERIVRIDNITRNTVTDSVYNTAYLLPTTVTAYTSLGNTREVPVTWTASDAQEEQDIPITEVSTSQAGTFTFSGTTPGYEPTFSFILTITDHNMYRIILSWGEHPNDLDSHLFGHYTEDGGDPFHLYYDNSIHQPDNVTIAKLERDITDGYGPETTSIYFDGHIRTYKFGVLHYSGMGTLATSGATIHLYRGDVLLASYQVSEETALQDTSVETAVYWNVFELVNDTLTSIDRLERQLYQPVIPPSIIPE